MNPVIKTYRLTKKFGKLVAVNNLDLDIKKGEIYGFIGPNGAGKTTTIKMLTGIFPPTSGRAEIGGFDIVQQPLEAKKIIGYIPDIPYVYPQITGREFLYFVGQLFAVKKLEEKIEKMLDIFPIRKIVDASFSTFSRGTKQKLAILAAFFHDPQVLIIDEPILGLDPESSKITKKMLFDFAKKGGTIFVSTHTLSIVEEICTRIGIIDKGKLIFEGNQKNLQRKVKSDKEHLEELFIKITK